MSGGTSEDGVTDLSSSQVEFFKICHNGERNLQHVYDYDYHPLSSSLGV